MGRYINPDGSGKIRTQLCKSVVFALRELMKQTEPDAHSRDLAAFIGMTLEEIYQTVETSVQAWEKKGYWVKADRFRMEWEWSHTLGEKLRLAIRSEDWAAVAIHSAQVAQKLMKVEVPARNRIGSPWEGAWERLIA